jgi:hypothetical protein
VTDQPQPSTFNVDTAAVLAILRGTHPDIVEAAEWRAAALQTAAERDQARAELAALQDQTAPGPTA